MTGLEKKSAMWGGIGFFLALVLLFTLGNLLLPLLYTEKKFESVNILCVSGISEDEVPFLVAQAEKNAAEEKLRKTERKPDLEVRRPESGSGLKKNQKNQLNLNQNSVQSNEKNEGSADSAEFTEQIQNQNADLNQFEAEIQTENSENQINQINQINQNKNEKKSQEDFFMPRFIPFEENSKYEEQRKKIESELKIREVKMEEERLRKIEEEKRIEEENRLEEQRLLRLEEEKKLAEERRLEAERQAKAEAEEKKKLKEMAEAKAEAARLEKAAAAREAAKKAEEERLARLEETRKQEALKKQETQRKLEEARKLEAERKRLAAEKAAAEKAAAEKAAAEKAAAEKKAQEKDEIPFIDMRNQSSISAGNKSNGGISKTAIKRGPLKIVGTTYSSQSVNGVSSSAKVNTGVTEDGKLAIKMTDGTYRTLISPAEPAITLSGEAASLITSSKKVVVSFSVSAAGNVVNGSMRINPSSLPYKIDMEMKEQISKWTFEKAQKGGAVSFIFSLNNE